jgi:hypothetical protein
MSSLSRAQLRSTIRTRGDYTNTRRFTNDYLNTEIQTAFGDFWRIVDEAHQGWWDTEGSVTTTVGVAYVALPADAKVIKGVDRLDGGEYMPMAQVGLDARNRWGSGNGKPLAYRLSSRGVELNRPSDAAYTLKVIYTPKPPQLTESEGREWYDGWENYVIEKVLLELDSRERMPLGDRLKKLELAEVALRASTNQRRQQEPEYLTLREYSDLDPYTDGILD